METEKQLWRPFKKIFQIFLIGLLLSSGIFPTSAWAQSIPSYNINSTSSYPSNSAQDRESLVISSSRPALSADNYHTYLVPPTFTPRKIEESTAFASDADAPNNFSDSSTLLADVNEPVFRPRVIAVPVEVNPGTTKKSAKKGEKADSDAQPEVQLVPVRETPSAPQTPLQMPVFHALPYGVKADFRPNILTTKEVKLPPSPATLKPMGEPIARKPKPIKPLVTIPKEEVHTPTPPPAPEVIIKVVSPPPAPPMIDSFIDWLHANPQATETARQEADKYHTQPISPKDPFLGIRFPYIGTEPTPTSSAVYTTPAP